MTNHGAIQNSGFEVAVFVVCAGNIDLSSLSSNSRYTALAFLKLTRNTAVDALIVQTERINILMNHNQKAIFLSLP